MINSSTHPASGAPIRRGLLAASLCVTALFAACGGGGGSASGPDAIEAPGVNASKPTSSSYALGPVTGFGSVIVGGVRFDDSGAKLSDEDGGSVSSSSVKLGSMLQVDASNMDTANATARADRLRLGSELVGPVSAVNASAGTAQVLGQAVLVSATTVFDSSLSGGLSAVTVGMVLEVHGLVDATSGQITATRIEPKTAATLFQVRGTVAALDAAAKTFKIGTALIAYGSTAASEVTSGLSNGMVVRVKLQPTQVAGAWVASSVRSGIRSPVAGQNARVEGVVTALTSTSSFELAGVKVDASGAAFSDGTAGVVLGARLEVTGTLTNGVLVATRVEVSGRRDAGSRPLELHGAIASLDATAKTFVLRNVVVAYSGSVTYKDGTEAMLTKDVQVEVYGVLSTDRTRLQAQRIEFKK